MSFLSEDVDFPEVFIFPEVDHSYSIIIHWNQYLSKKIHKFMFKHCEKINPDEWNKTCLFGRPIPRLTKWYHKSLSYKFANTKWKSNECETWLKEISEKIKEDITKRCEHIINSSRLFKNMSQKQKQNLIQIPSIESILIEYLRNEDDCVALHNDSKLEYGKNPTIMYLGIGEKRKLTIKQIKEEARFKYCKKNGYKYDVILDEKKNKYCRNKPKHIDFNCGKGSLTIFAGHCQKWWTHEFKKEYAKFGEYLKKLKENIKDNGDKYLDRNTHHYHMIFRQYH